MSASAAASTEPATGARRSRAYGLAHADWLKLWKRRGLFWTILGMTIGAETIAFAVLAILHSTNPAHHGPAGGIANLGHGMFILNLLGAVAATIVGANAGSGDLSAGVFRELVVTGRSRLALFAARIPGGLAFLLPFTAVAFTIAAVVSATANGFLDAPSATLMLESGLWVLAEAAFYYLIALALASLTGSRAYTIGILLAWRLILARILMSIGFLGVFREVVPDVSFARLVPAGVADWLQEGPDVPASLAASIAVPVIWIAVWLAIGAWRTVTRDA